jgi:hypothetical protein
MLFEGDGAHVGLSVVLVVAIMERRIALGNDGGVSEWQVAAKAVKKDGVPRSDLDRLVAKSSAFSLSLHFSASRRADERRAERCRGKSGVNRRHHWGPSCANPSFSAAP